MELKRVKFLFRMVVEVACFVIVACCFPAGGQTQLAVAQEMTFGVESQLGDASKNPSTPYLRFAPNGRLFAIWTEDDDRADPSSKQATMNYQHEWMMKRAPSPAREAMLASSADGGVTLVRGEANKSAG